MVLRLAPMTEENDVVRVRANDAFDVRKVAAYKKAHRSRFKPAPVLIDPALLAALVDVVGAAKDFALSMRDEWPADHFDVLVTAITRLESLA